MFIVAYTYFLPTSYLQPRTLLSYYSEPIYTIFPSLIFAMHAAEQKYHTQLFDNKCCNIKAGTTVGIESNLEDSASSLIYFGGGNTSIINGSSWSDDNDDDDLPGYESIVCLVESRQRVDGTSRDSSSVEHTEESPPPSYNDVVHLYSFER